MSLAKLHSSAWQYSHHANKDHKFFSFHQRQDKLSVTKKLATDPNKKMTKGHKENQVIQLVVSC